MLIDVTVECNIVLKKVLRSTLGECILFMSLLSRCCAISGFGCHLGLVDHSPQIQFHGRALNAAGQVKSHRLTRFSLDTMRSNAQVLLIYDYY